MTVTVESAQRVAALRATFMTGRTRELGWRREQLRGIDALLHENTTLLEDTLCEDLGRSRTETFLSEVYAVQREVRSLARGLPRWTRTRRVFVPPVLWPARSSMRHEPLGIVLVIGPWNYPLNLVLAPLAAALAAGNAVAVKPSELAPHSSAVLAELLPRYVDPECVAVFEGGPEQSQALIAQGFDHVFFTGSPVVGRSVMAQAAEHLTPVTLELGGKSPVIVANDADVAVTARRIAWGKFLNAGQSCIAPDYVLALPAVKERLLEALFRSLDDFYGKDASRSPDFGRIVNGRHLERLAGLLHGHRGELVRGGEVRAGERYVEPTIIVDPAPDSPLMQEEIFGPILPVIGVEDLGEALAFVNARPLPIALYVFARDRAFVREALTRTRSGTVAVNTTMQQFASSYLPFGGVGPSGMGAYHGRFGFEQLSHLRPVFDRPTWPDPSVAYPPFGALTRQLLRTLRWSGIGRRRGRDG